MERRNLFRVTALTLAIGLGAAALESPDTQHHDAQTAACTVTDGQIAAEGTPDLTFNDIRTGINNTRFVLDSAEYQSPDYRSFAALLSRKGIEVVGDGHNDGEVFRYGGVEILGDDFEGLAFTSQKIMEAAGLKKIIISSQPDSSEEPYTEPPHTQDTLTIRNSYDLEVGLSAMILDNYCSPEERQHIYDTFTALTKEAGTEYNPNYKPNYDNDAMTAETIHYFDKHYSAAFSDPDSVHNPRLDFLTRFAAAIGGTFSGLYPPDQPNTIKNRKKEFASALYDRIEPNGPAWRELDGYGFHYGTRGLPPNRLIGRIGCLRAALDGKTPAQQKHIFDVDGGRIAANDTPDDPKVPYCDGQFELNLAPLTPDSSKSPLYDFRQDLLETQ